MVRNKATFVKLFIWEIDLNWLRFEKGSLLEIWEVDETWVKSWVAPWVLSMSLYLQMLE
jgi:hypothetical protein